MRVKTAELIGEKLDLAVALCEGRVNNSMPMPADYLRDFNYKPSVDWSQGGLIIEREQINLIWSAGYPVKATIYRGGSVWIDREGETPLVAAMRCYVANRLGDEIELPDSVI